MLQRSWQINKMDNHTSSHIISNNPVLLPTTLIKQVVKQQTYVFNCLNWYVYCEFFLLTKQHTSQLSHSVNVPELVLNVMINAM